MYTHSFVDLSAATTGAPDLAVVGLQAYQHPEGGVVVQGVCENQGDESTANGYATGLYVDHLPTGSGDYSGSVQFWFNSAIAAGETVTVVTRIDNGSSLMQRPLAPAAEAEHTIVVQIDSGGTVGEPDERDNISPATAICLTGRDAYEGDTGFGTATSLLVGGSQLRNFDQPGDEDWVEITAQAGVT